MAKRIPPHKVEEIYNIADILDIVGEFVQLKKRGTNWFGLSPWTSEKTPSFAVSPSKNIFKDFSTGKGGNAVTFLMEAESMSYVEALKWIANRYGIELELEETPEEQVSADKRESLLVITDFAAKWFHTQLTTTDEGKRIGLTYFKERGLLESTLSKYELGYSPESWDAFAKHALQKQFKQEFLVDTGLCYVAERDGNLNDRFHGRVIFPIHDHMGKVIAFGGRILSNEKKVAKYINSPETELYHKSKVLYGLAFAKNSIRDKDQCILVEGYMDCVMLAQAGIQNVVASSGTALTEEQIRLIKRFTQNVLLIYDADNAGINAALRGVDLMLEAGLYVRVLLLPEGHDPDSFVKERGKSGFDTYCAEKAADFIDFKIDHLTGKKRLTDPQEKTQIIHDTASTLARIPDLVQQAVYLDRAAERIGIGRDIMDRALRQAVNERVKTERRDQRRAEARSGQQSQQYPQTYDTPPPPDYGDYFPVADGETLVQERQVVPTISNAQEEEVIRLMLNHGSSVVKLPTGEEMKMADFFVREISHIEFESPHLEKFRMEIFKRWEEKEDVGLNNFLQHEDPTIAAVATRMVAIPYEVSPNWEKYGIRAPKLDESIDDAAFAAVLHYQLKQVRKLITENRGKLKLDPSEAEEQEILRVGIQLTSLQKQLTDILGIVVPQ